MRRHITTFLILIVVASLLHFVWEKLHLPLYAGYQHLGSGLVLTVYATAGDVMYTIGAVLLVALFKKKLYWVSSATGPDYIGLSVLGLCIAFFVEYKAMALHLWSYTHSMPIVWGVGLSPLLQMTILLPLSVYITKRLIARR